MYHKPVSMVFKFLEPKGHSLRTGLHFGFLCRKHPGNAIKYSIIDQKYKVHRCYTEKGLTFFFHFFILCVPSQKDLTKKSFYLILFRSEDFIKETEALLLFSIVFPFWCLVIGSLY